MTSHINVGPFRFQFYDYIIFMGFTALIWLTNIFRLLKLLFVVVVVVTVVHKKDVW